jgi:hypothetical protein
MGREGDKRGGEREGEGREGEEAKKQRKVSCK